MCFDLIEENSQNIAFEVNHNVAEFIDRITETFMGLSLEKQLLSTSKIK